MGVSKRINTAAIFGGKRAGRFSFSTGGKTTRSTEGLIFVSGREDVDNALRLILPKLQGKALRKATRASARVVLDAARQIVPTSDYPADGHASGTLKRSLKVRAMKRSRTRQGHSVFSGDSKTQIFSGKSYYGAFVELGTKYQAAQPFMRVSLYQNESKVKAIFFAELKKGISELAVT